MANNLITENYMRLNYTSKAGITPGTDDHVILTAEEIQARYNVTVSPSTGRFCPKYPELSGVISPFTLIAKGFWSQSSSSGAGWVLDSSVKLVVMTIHTSDYFYRSYTGEAAPRINGIAMTQAGNYHLSVPTEIWYMINPPTGSVSFLVDTNVQIEITISAYHALGTISLHSHNYDDSLSYNPTITVAIPQNTNILTIDACTVQSIGGMPTFTFGTYSHTNLYVPATAVPRGRAVQYNTEYSGSSQWRTMTRALSDDDHPWYNVGVCFKTT